MKSKNTGKTRSRISRRMDKIALRKKSPVPDNISGGRNAGRPPKQLSINWKKNFELAKVVLAHKLPVKTSLSAAIFAVAFGLAYMAPSLAQEVRQPGAKFIEQSDSVVAASKILAFEANGWRDFAAYFGNSFNQISDIQKNALAEQGRQPKELLAFLGNKFISATENLAVGIGELKGRQARLYTSAAKINNALPSNPESGLGKVLSASTMSPPPAASPSQTVIVQKTFYAADLNSQIESVVNQYLSAGKFTGPQGVPGPQGAGDSNTVYQIAPPIPLDNYDGGTAFSATQLSSDTFVANDAQIQTLEVSDNASFNNISANDINFAGTLYQNGVPFVAGSASSTWSTSGSNTYYNLGNVGIGTTTPGQLLTIVSATSTNNPTIQIVNTNSAGNAQFTSTNDVGLQTSLWTAGSATGFEVNRGVLNGPALSLYADGNSGTGDIRFYAYPSGGFSSRSPITISNGRLGIATVTPTAYADIYTKNNDASTNLFQLSTVTSNVPTSRFLVTNSGKVGIGTSGPTSTLSIQGSTGVNPFIVTSSTGATLLSVQSNGKIGIGGVNNPIDQLSIYDDAAGDGIGLYDGSGNLQGNIYAQSGTTTRGLQLNVPGQTGQNSNLDNFVAFRFNSSTSKVLVGDTGAASWLIGFHNLNFFSGVGTASSTPQMTLTTGGNLGIGTTTPAQKLSVIGNMRLTGALFDSNNASGTLGMLLQSKGTGTQWVATSTLGISGGSSQWITNGSNIYYNSGFVGIGNTSPASPLDITSTSTIGISYSNTSGHALIKVNGADASQAGYYIFKGGAEKAQIEVPPSSNDLTFNMAGTERFRIGGTGNIGINDTNPGAKLSVVGNAAIGYASNQAAPTNGLVIQGNVGIGTSTPLAKFHVQDGSANIIISNNSFGGDWGVITTDPALGFGSYGLAQSITNGTFLNSASGTQLALRINNVSKLTVASNGNVGIGTTTPQALLSLPLGITAANGINFGDVQANLYRSAASTIKTDGSLTVSVNMVAGLISGNTVATAGSGIGNGAATSWNVGNTSQFGFSSTGAYNGALDVSLSRISAGVIGVGNGTVGSATGTLVAGNIGIGTSTPGSRLVIQGSGITSATAAQTIYNASGTLLTTILNNGNLGIGTSTPGSTFVVAGTSLYTSTSSFLGNVGISVASPLTKFQINTLTSGLATNHGNILLGEAGVTGPEAQNGIEFQTSATSFGVGTKIYSNSTGGPGLNGYVGFASRNNSSSWTENMIIDQTTGAVSIGTTTINSAKLVVASASLYNIYGVSSNAGGYNAVFTNSATGNGCSLSGASTAWSCSSDENLKTNINTISGADALAGLSLMKGVAFNWKSLPDGPQQIGVIAQDVQKAFPQAVSTNTNGYLSVQYDALIGPLISGVNELNSKLDSLQQTVNNLQNSGSDLASSTAISVQLYLSADSVGEAKIIAGQNSVRISFNSQYQYQPIITITPIGSFVPGYVADADAGGFTIKIDDADIRHQTNDSLFAWHAFAGQAAQLTVSDGTTQNIQLVLPAPPAPLPTPPPAVLSDETSVPSGDASSTPEITPAPIVETAPGPTPTAEAAPTPETTPAVTPTPDITPTPGTSIPQ